MGKSLGNAIRPLDLPEVYGADAFRYFLLRDTALDRDAEFSRERIENRYQGDLANDLGNLLHRLVHMVGRYCGGRIPAPGDPAAGVPTAHEETLRERCLALSPEASRQCSRDLHCVKTCAGSGRPESAGNRG